MIMVLVNIRIYTIHLSINFTCNVGVDCGEQRCESRFVGTLRQLVYLRILSIP